MRKPLLVLSGVFSLHALLTTQADAAVARRYVKHDATGTPHDGTSWCNAYTGLQEAIDWAETAYDPENIPEIWVAAGTYKPANSGTAHCISGNTRSFCITSPVRIYGGFSGTETLRPQRDAIANLTTLSGDFLGNDVGEADDPTHTENASSVVAFDDFPLTFDNTLLDGFTITGGYNSNPYYLAGGGGILFSRGNATIRNCNITENYAVQGGGAIYSTGELTSHLVGCKITKNKANHGGAMALKGVASPRIFNCDISDNHSTDQGGAFYLAGAPGSDTLIVNSIVARNVADDLPSGGLYLASSGHYSLVNSVVGFNSSPGDGAGIRVEGSFNPINMAGISVSIKNSIVWGNAGMAANGIRQIHIHANNVNLPPKVEISSSDVQRWNSDGNDVSTAVTFVGTGNLGTSELHDPLFVNTAGPNYNYQLFPNSPCAEHGDTSLLPPDKADVDQDGNKAEALPLDFGGFKRVEDDLDAADPGLPTYPPSCAFVDMGACETPTRDSLAFPPTSEPNGIPKSRYISFLPHAGYSAIRVDLTYLNHPYPTGVSATDMTAIEGQSRWVGPPEWVYQTGGAKFVAKLQCQPFLDNWSDTTVIHVYGPEVGPDSAFEVRTVLPHVCSQGVVDRASRFSAPLQVTTSRWADVTTPQFLTSCGFGNQPNMLDIAAIVTHFNAGPNFISHQRAQLRNGYIPCPGCPGLVGDTPDPHDPVSFIDISLAIDAYQEKLYPYDGLHGCE